MEKLMRLPPGFRFHPTDEELVVHYLKSKALSWPLPAAIIPDIDIGKYDPWDLPGCQEGERYFFNLQESRCRKGNRSNRATRSGYWKATGKDRAIHGSSQNEIVGMKKVLIFHQGKPLRSVRTQWIMHEYRLSSSETLASISSPIRKSSNQCSMYQGKDWVVCRIFKKKKRASSFDEEDIVQYRNNNIWNLGPQSPTSSCVTDVSDEECINIGEEEASSKLIASSSAP